MGRRRFTLAQAFEMYLSANKMKDRSRDTYQGHWRRDIEPVLGHYYIEEVDTSSLDELKRTLPDHFGPKSVNHRVKLVGTVLRLMWKRGHLQAVPHVPAEVSVAGDIDLRGTLCVSQEVPVGFQHMGISVRLELGPDTPPRMKDKLLAAAEHCCVVLRTLRQGVPVTIDLSTDTHAGTVSKG